MSGNCSGGCPADPVAAAATLCLEGVLVPLVGAAGIAGNIFLILVLRSANTHGIGTLHTGLTSASCVYKSFQRPPE